MADTQFLTTVVPALVQRVAGFPDPSRGYSDRPEIEAWARLAQAGLTTTVAERNVFVCQLAWMQDYFAARPDASLLERPMFERQLTLDAQGRLGLVLGAQGFEGGDVTFRAPSGSAVMMPTSAPANFTVTEAFRREGFELLRATLQGLRLEPGQLRLAQNPDPPRTAPAGVVQAAAVLPALGYLLVASVAVYAVYTAGQSYVEAHRHEAAEVTARVRVQENAVDARTAVQVTTCSGDYARRVATFERTGVMPPPSELCRAIQATPPGGTDPNKWKSELASDLASTAAWTAGGLVALFGVKAAVQTLLEGKSK